jgi:hypothetical protein
LSSVREALEVCTSDQIHVGKRARNTSKEDASEKEKSKNEKEENEETSRQDFQERHVKRQLLEWCRPIV